MPLGEIDVTARREPHWLRRLFIAPRDVGFLRRRFPERFKSQTSDLNSGEVEIAQATAGKGDQSYPESVEPPQRALRADLSPPGRGEGRALSLAAKNAYAGVRALARGVLDLALPPQCLACEKPVTQTGGLCVACWGALKLIERPYCERLGAPFPADFGPGLLSPAAIARPPAFDRARAVARFDGTARELVHRLKYGDAVHLAKPIGAMMARAGHELLGEGAVVMPVPLHRSRLWTRRFNQSALLAREVARISGAELRLQAIERVKATRPQVGLTAAQRAENLAGAFRVADRAAIAGRRVVIVDDVVTTGATIDRLARLLRRAGAASVDALTFAVVVKEA